MEFRVLGPVRAMDGGAELALGGPRQRRLLAALLLGDGRVVSLDRLVEAVWGDEAPPPGASRTVLSYVSRLRTALGEGYVSTRGEGYVLDPADALVDADRFASLVRTAGGAPPARALLMLDEALGLWSGRAFGDLADEDWCRPAATRLEELRLVALEERAQARLDLGAHGEVVAELEQLTTEHPLRDRFRAQLMIALYRSGRQAEALRSFQEHRRFLADETGLDPSRELVELERRIALADPSLLFVTAGRTERGYVLADVIGEGAFGTVYRAVQPSVGREVAVKVVRAELADDPDYVRRFEGEARLVARLEHPHIVPLYDFWREPGAAYLVFRYLRGGSVEAASRAVRKWPLSRVGRLMEEVGAALAVAHDAGVVHRDVKPANVLFDEVGNSYLADFGIATDVLDAPSTDGLRSAGSPLYASPEQVRDGVATPRSDQYALAVMAWELLAGAPPFEGDRITTLLRAKLEATVPALGDRRPDVPTEIDAVLQRAAALHPDDRFASMGDLLVAWREAATRPVSAAVTTGSLDRVDGAPAMSTMASVALEVANPYKGLQAFDEADARDFHGRESAVDRLAALVNQQRFVVVVGASGSGKSSLVRAGLLPRLRAERRLVTLALPGAHPVDAIAEAFIQVAVERPIGLTDALLDPQRLASSINALLPPDGSELVLVLDQFEELWTLDQEGVRDRLLDALVAATSADDSRLRIVATVRADFYDRPLSHPAIGALVETATFSLAPLGPAELDRVMSAPAGRVGVRLEPALLAELVADVAARPASLPLLQYALTELFDHRDGATMTLAAYEAMGGMAGALTARAEAIYADCDDGERAAVRRLFARLVAPGEGTMDTRRRARRSELATIPPGLIDTYGAARLLTFDVDPFDREPTVEVGHEALIQQWPRLRGWLDEDRDGLRVHRHLADTAAGWDRRGRDNGELYRGTRLTAATEWAGHHNGDLAPTERAFLTESRRRARRNRRLAETAVGTLAVLLVVALLAAGLAFTQRRRADDNAAAAQANAAAAQASAATAQQKATEAASARDAEAVQRTASDLRRLSFQAQAVAEQQPQLGLLLAEEAYQRRPDAESESALQAALVSLESITKYVPFPPAAGGNGNDAATPDGRLLAFASGTSVLLMDGETLRLTGVRVETGVTSPSIALSTDGREMATATAAGELRRWDTSTGRETAPLVKVTPGTSGADGPPIVYRADGRLLASDASDVLVLGPGQTSPERRIHIEGSFIGGLYRLAWSPRGDAAVLRFARPQLFNATTERVSDLPIATVFAAGFDLDHGIVMVIDYPGNLVVIRLSDLAVLGGPYPGVALTGPPVRLSDGTIITDKSDGGVVRWAPDGRLLPALTLGGTALGPLLKLPSGLLIAAQQGAAVVIDPTGRGLLAHGLGHAGTPGAGSNKGLFALTAPTGVTVVDPGTGEQRSGPFPTSGETAAAVSPDGRYLATRLLVGPEPTLRMIETATGRQVGDDVPGDNFGLAFSPNGTRFAYAAARSIVVEETGTRRVVLRLPMPNDMGVVGYMRWSPDGGTLFVSPLGGQPLGIDMASGAIRWRLDGAHVVSWSADGTMMADAWQGSLTLLDPTTGSPIRELKGFTGVGMAGFSADGQRLVRLRQSDGALEVIDLASASRIGRRIETGATLSPGNGALVVPDDGKTAYVGSIITELTAYDVDPASWAVKACAAAGRNLTRQEWAQYVGTLGDYRATCPQYPTS